MSKSYVIGDGGTAPYLPGDAKWQVLRLAMGYVGTTPGGVSVTSNVVVPPFLMVVTDREAAKREVCERLDAIFDVVEEDRRLEDSK